MYAMCGLYCALTLTHAQLTDHSVYFKPVAFAHHQEAINQAHKKNHSSYLLQNIWSCCSCTSMACGIYSRSRTAAMLSSPFCLLALSVPFKTLYKDVYSRWKQSLLVSCGVVKQQSQHITWKPLASLSLVSVSSQVLYNKTFPHANKNEINLFVVLCSSLSEDPET